MQNIALELAPYVSTTYLDAVTKQTDAIHNIMHGLKSSRGALQTLDFFKLLDMTPINLLLLQ